MAFKKVSIGFLLAAGLLGAYVVKEGDTLWDISDDKLDNPFSWPVIWEKNPHIDNPHLIYPGQEIAVEGESLTQASQKLPRQAQQSTNATLRQGMSRAKPTTTQDLNDDFLNRVQGMDIPDSLKINLSAKNKIDVSGPRQFPVLNKMIQLQAPQLTLPLNDERTFPSEVKIYPDETKTGKIIIPGNKLVVNLGTNDNIKVGDTLDLFQHQEDALLLGSGASERSYKSHIVSGFAVVKEMSETSSRVEVVKLKNPLTYQNGRAMKRNTPKTIEVMDYELATSAAVDNMARVIKRYTDSKLIQNFDYINIDRGTKENFQVGDAVAIWNREETDQYDIPPRLIGKGIVAWTGPSTSSILVLEQIELTRNPNLRDYVSITHKAIYRIK